MTTDNFIANQPALDGLVKTQPKHASTASTLDLPCSQDDGASFNNVLKDAVTDSQKVVKEPIQPESGASECGDGTEHGRQNLPIHDPEIAALLQLLGQENFSAETELEDLAEGLPETFAALPLQYSGLSHSLSQNASFSFGDDVPEPRSFLQYLGSSNSVDQGMPKPTLGLNNGALVAGPIGTELLPSQLDVHTLQESALKDVVGSRGDVLSMTDLSLVKSLPQRSGNLTGSAEISLRTKEPEVFATGLATYLRVLKTEGGTEARLQLSPIELGRLAITIQTEGDDTRVSFVVENSQARSAVEASLPRLREMLEQSGLSLADAEVTEQHQNDREDRDKALQNSEDSSNDENQSDPSLVASSRDPSSLVDAYV